MTRSRSTMLESERTIWRAQVEALKATLQKTEEHAAHCITTSRVSLQYAAHCVTSSRVSLYCNGLNVTVYIVAIDLAC